jgi:methylmalonyl-CoA/ethylmalonyl-CoA epimerase
MGIIGKRLEHIGIAVKDSEKAASFFSSVLGFEDKGCEILKDMKLKVRKVKLSNLNVELLEPLEGEEVISRFLTKNGEGIHHIAFEVENIDTAISHIKSRGYTLAYEKPKRGAGEKLVNFLHPKETHGILIEITQ